MATPPPPAPHRTVAVEIEPDWLYEVVDGQVVEKPPMGAFEVDIAIKLVVASESFARSHLLGRRTARCSS